MAEYKTGVQVNYGFGLSFEASGKAPVIAKRIWETLADAQAYVDSSTDTAIAGLQLTVINDTDASKNGVYFVKEAAGENGKTVGVLVKLAQGADTSNLQTQVTANKQAIDNLNGTTDATSVTKKIKDAIGALDVTNNTSDAVNGVKVTVNQVDGVVQKPAIEIKTGSVKKDDTGLVTGAAVRTAIDAAVGTTYKVRGCVENYADLPTEDRNVGDVWNIQNAFTLPDDSKPYPAGTNVVWVGAHSDGEGTAHAAHWDALGGTVDLSGYAQKADLKYEDTRTEGGVIVEIDQTNGKIAPQRVNVGTLIATGYKVADTYAVVDSKDSINTALGKLQKGVTEAKSAISNIDTGVTSIDMQKGDIGFETVQKGVRLSITKATAEANAKLKAELVGEVITEGYISSNAVTTNKIKDGNVTKAKLTSDVQASLDKADNSVQYTDFDVNIADGALSVYGQITSKSGTLQLGADAQTSYDIMVQSTAAGETGDVPAIKFSEGANDVVLTGVKTPISASDAANKSYVDTKVGAVDTGVITIGNTKAGDKAFKGDVKFLYPTVLQTRSNGYLPVVAVSDDGAAVSGDTATMLAVKLPDAAAVRSISNTTGNITLDSAKTYGNIALSIANNATTGENYIAANLSWTEI